MAWFDQKKYYQLYVPKLDQTEFEVTSEETSIYNCIAWVLEKDDDWISPVEDYIWPEEVERGHTISNYINLFKFYGFEECENSDLEVEYKKIAIYIDHFNSFKHVAK